MSFCIIPADQRDCYTTNLHLRATKQRSPHHHCSHSEWATVTQGSFISLLLARGGAATANGIRLSEVLQRWYPCHDTESQWPDFVLFLPTRQVLHWTTYFLKNGVQQLSMYVFYSLVGVSEVSPNQQRRVCKPVLGYCAQRFQIKRCTTFWDWTCSLVKRFYVNRKILRIGWAAVTWSIQPISLAFWDSLVSFCSARLFFLPVRRRPSLMVVSRGQYYPVTCYCLIFLTKICVWNYRRTL